MHSHFRKKTWSIHKRFEERIIVNICDEKIVCTCDATVMSSLEEACLPFDSQSSGQEADLGASVS